MHRADRFYLAWPAAYDRWAAQIGGVEGASVARMAVNQGWVEGDTEGLPARVKLPIVKPLTGKSVGIFHGTALTAEGEGALLPHRLFPVNPDIQFKTETQTVDGK